MPIIPLPYFSDGYRLDADLHLPEGDGRGPYPVAVAASGYRGFGLSEGGTGDALCGGVVVAEASQDQRVRTLVCCNGIADGYRATQEMHRADSWNLLLERVSADRGRRAVVDSAAAYG